MFTLVIIGILGFMILGVLTFAFFKLDDDDIGPFCVLGSIMAVLFFGWIIGFCIAIPSYVSAKTKAELLNNKYGTEYTTEQIFWASDVVEKLIRTENDLKDNNQRIDLNIDNK